MSDELDREKELSERFSSHTKAASESEDSSNANDSNGADDASTSHHSGDTGDTHGAKVDKESIDRTRDRKQYVMYLPPELHQALNERFNRYDGIAKITAGDGIEKHKDFNEALVRAGLESDHLDEYVGVPSSLDDE